MSGSKKAGNTSTSLTVLQLHMGMGQKIRPQMLGESQPPFLVVIPRSWPTKNKNPLSFPELLSRGPIYRSFPVVECPGILVQ